MDILIILNSILTVISFLVILSYYSLFFIKKEQKKVEMDFKSISIILPAHNEEKYIHAALNHVLDAKFYGKKEIIVVDDGSTDNTTILIKKYFQNSVILIEKKHTGKSDSINCALKIAKGDLIAIVDADTFIDKNSLLILADEVSRDNIAAACAIIKVANRKKSILIWTHLELLYNSLIRYLLSKINANIVTPGALSVYRRLPLEEIGGFSTKGYCEDADIAIRLIRKGYKISFNEKAITSTNMPEKFSDIIKQRRRIAEGSINLLKRHLQMNSSIIDLYSLPLMLFVYLQALISSFFITYQIIGGYFQYFVKYGVYFSWDVLVFFFNWFSIFGFISWAYKVIAGIYPFTFIAILGIASGLLSYPLFILAVIKYDKKIDIFHIIPFCFMFPYWIFLMFISVVSLPSLLSAKQENKWHKNG